MEAPAALERFRQEVEEELRAVLQGRGTPLSQLLAYQLGWVDEMGTPLSAGGGRRCRSVLCLSACRAAGGDYQVALPAAAAMELIHNFSLVHGDVQGGNPERQHRPTVWWVWGPAQAINVGDALHALARLALFRLQERSVSHERVLEALNMLDRATLRLCEGQHLDLTYQERLEVAEEAYLNMVEGKAGALLGCALGMGAFLGGGDPSMLASFDEAGRKLGMALQVRRDILELWPAGGQGQTPASDVLNKKKSLPVIDGLARVQGPQKRELGSYYFKRVLEPQDAKEVARILEEVGAREYAQGVAQRLFQEALDSLDQSGVPSGNLEELKEVARYLMEFPG